jgi:hypothetical protein
VYGWACVVGRQSRIQFGGVGTECVGERLCDPAWVRMNERSMADRVTGGRWCKL